MTEEAARAFVPGHVTGFFSVHRDDDPAKSGSRGAGIALSDGTTVSVSPAAEREVHFAGERIEMGAPERVLETLGVTARVAIETPLPLGAGFGVSGGTALGTALAANARFEREHTENELAGIAHAAEVEAGTGLGDVVAQARGGVPLRLEPGGPGVGRLDGISATARIEYVTFGDLSTAEVLAGNTDELSAAGERALVTLRDRPTMKRFMACSRAFAREVGLLTPQVAKTISDVRENGGEAAMAMLGETVVALGTGLTDAGYDPAVCRIHSPGATLLDSTADSIDGPSG